MITALQKSESGPNFINDLMKASEKLGKVLSEASIRVLVDSTLKKNGAEMYVLTASLSSFFIQFSFPLLKFSLLLQSREGCKARRENSYQTIGKKQTRS